MQQFSKTLGIICEFCLSFKNVTVGVFMSVSHNWFFLHICRDLWPQFFLQQSRLPLLKPQQGSGSGIRGGSRFFNLKQVTLTQDSLGWKEKKMTLQIPRNQCFYLLWVHTNRICFPYQHTCSCQHRGLLVWPAEVRRTKWRNETVWVTVCCWSLENRWRFSL